MSGLPAGFERTATARLTQSGLPAVRAGDALASSEAEKAGEIVDENQTYYFTFAASHPLSDNWIEVSAPNAKQARAAFVAEFGTRWGFQYEDVDFHRASFPGGRAGRVLEVI